MDVFEKLEKHFGSGAAVSRALGHKNRQTFNNWKARGRIPPAECPVVFRAAGGCVSLHELRPDIYPVA